MSSWGLTCQVFGADSTSQGGGPLAAPSGGAGVDPCLDGVEICIIRSLWPLIFSISAVHFLREAILE